MPNHICQVCGRRFSGNWLPDEWPECPECIEREANRMSDEETDEYGELKGNE